jgi:uncharacterized circularly permuted ATP-grasp superfamily protein/uncharacterized alpha-E superfamily protein
MMRELLADYPPAEGRYDEMLAAPGTPRPHWERVFQQLGATSPEMLRERVQWVRRQVRENGVTYNVYADAEGADRPWELDTLPLILPADEWAAIEAAVRQRATLLNRVLMDVYGEQRLLAEGMLPPALVYGHAGFLRPCRGVKAPGEVMLHLYAADLARSPDGRWWVVDDRTQAPSGAGYALENRLVISRLYADLFRDLRVQRLAGFFATLRDSLAHWAPVGEKGGAPFTVLLTPGPLNETYFEHTYLARYLGIALVEGSDLTVREDKVYLKTLTGLKRVHVILRRLDDDFCDPLELRSDSALGIPGLVEAARRGNVLVANGLGSNLLESGALLGFLPRLSERLLGEALKMPSVATWWCGEPAALEQVIKNLDRLVIKGAYSQMRVEPMFGEDLDERGRARVVAMLRARPQMYVAQELVQLSQAPVCDRAQVRASAIGLRVYACASPNGYVVMPGGLTRAATGNDARVISMQRGGSSKDTWVLSTGPVSSFSLLKRETRPQDLVRTGLNLSSRVVENLYWFGRNAERCDGMARLLRIALTRVIEVGPAERDRSWTGIAAMLQQTGIFGDQPPAEEVAIARALRAAVLDDARPGLASGLKDLLRVASQLRERLSLDNWRTLNQMARRLQAGRGRQAPLSETLAELDRNIAAFMTLAGFALDGMTRDNGWRFLSIGRRIERLQFMCTLLEQALAGPADADLGWILELADSSITYRSRYMARPEWLPVLDLLVRDVHNPRSIYFQLKGLNDFVGRVYEAFGVADAAGGEPQERMDQAVREIESLDPGADLRHGSVRLLALLRAWNHASGRLSEQLGLRFFSHSGEVNRQTFAT